MDVVLAEIKAQGKKKALGTLFATIFAAETGKRVLCPFH